MKKSFAVFFLACVISLSFIILGTGFAAGLETLNVGLPGDAHSLDPQMAVDTMSFTAAKHLYEPLVTVDGKTKKLVPVLAERWEMLDQQTYKFYLKKGVKFHNGEPFTAEDVVFSLTRGATKSVHAGSKGGYVDTKGFKIIDDHTLIVKTNGPVGSWLEGMKHPYATIFNKKAVEAAGENYFRNPVGTGPFKFKKWVKGERIELTAFDGYHGKKPNFKNLNFLVLPDQSSRVIALETGKVDLIYAVPPSDVDRINSENKAKVVNGQGLVLIHLALNTQKAPLNDVRVRKAIDYAINKEAYNKVVYKGSSKLPNGPLPLASAFTPKNSLARPYDIAKAKGLLKEAGYAKGFPLKLWVINFQDRIDGATVIQSMLAQVGIKVEIEVFDSGVFDEKIKAATHDMVIHTWGMQTNRDAGVYWLPMLHSKGIGSTNRAAFANKEVDALIDKVTVTVDTQERNKVLQQLWDKLGEECPIIGLSIPGELYGVRKDIIGAEDFYDGRINYLGNLRTK